MARAIPALTALLLSLCATALPAQTLKGSRYAMQRQNSVAREQDYTFLRTSSQVRKFADAGLLVRVKDSRALDLDGVSHPYARPAMKTFLDRLSAQHHAACGEKLVVTSLTRPVTEQPRNASDLSVHPTGMAADLRISRKGSCQRWLERTLLDLEDEGVLDATRERRPPHYHVAVFPEAYLAHVRKVSGSKLAAAESKPARSSSKSTSSKATSSPKATALAATTPDDAELDRYEVNRGDTLWTIARRYHTTVEQLKELNRLHTNRIAAGQVIAVPN